MALSAAERAKKYRDKKKNDPRSRETFARKENARKRRSYVPVTDRTPREQRKQRKNWKKGQKRFRDKQKLLDEFAPLSPPPTPPHLPPIPPLAMPPPPPPRPIDRRIANGRKKVKTARAKAYRTIHLLEKQLDAKMSLMEKWKKKYYRERDTRINTCSSTPRSRARKMLVQCHVPPTVRKQLIFSNAVIDQIRKKYKDSRTCKVKQALRRSVASVQMKYRMINVLSSQVGVSRSLLMMKDRGKNLSEHARKIRSDRIKGETKSTIRAFLERDDNSRQMPGKKDTVTFKQVKKQKRLLNDTMKVLHAKFTYENPNLNIHYCTFCRMKPFWIVRPTLRDVDTCMCKKCTNIAYMHQKLVTEKVLSSGQPQNSLVEIVCDKKNKKCMYGECAECSTKRMQFNINSNAEKKITYQQWVTKEKTYGDDKTAKVTIKETTDISLAELCHKFESEIRPRYSTHIHNIFNQYTELKKLKEGLNDNEVVIHMDFSENYVCKGFEEIQSAHFGGSHNQVSLHTGVYYMSNKQATSFCTISSCTRHDPSGIWGHVTPILQKIRSENPAVNSVHFVSDGPTTQYRNKTNFWLTSTVPRTLGFKTISWNFLEAGHGKGAPDGIGGVIKRTADAIVALGKDVLSAESLLEELQQRTTVFLHFVSQKDIEAYDSKIPELKTVEGTMKIHQILFPDQAGIVEHRVLSCFCESPCHETTRKSLILKAPPRSSTSKDVPSTLKDVPSTSKDVPSTLKDVPSTSKDVPSTLKDVPSTSKDIPSTSDNPTTTNTVSLLQPLNASNARNDVWCVVLYDKQPYPGQIKDVDSDSVEVSTMSRVGNNRFFWPAREDRIWYDYDKVLTVIPPVSKVGSRHYMIDVSFWEEISQLVEDLDLVNSLIVKRISIVS